jgi:hypothetical protein
LSKPMDTVRIIGTGSYLPPTILANFDLKEMGPDTTDDWFLQRTGIRERRIANHDISEASHDGNNYIIHYQRLQIKHRGHSCEGKTLTVRPNFQALGK